MDLRDRLREAAEAAGYVIRKKRGPKTEKGAAQLAEKIGEDPSYLSKYLNKDMSKVTRSIEILRKLARELEVSFAWLAAGIGGREPTADDLADLRARVAFLERQRSEPPPPPLPAPPPSADRNQRDHVVDFVGQMKRESQTLPAPKKKKPRKGP